jgi:Na+-transporting methylmalonyl-CoA/oxaloacetate decarboxylase gamma subunit
MINSMTFLAAETPSVGFVCFLGIAVVFLGLACIIGIVWLMNIITDRLQKASKKPVKADTPKRVAPVQSQQNAPIANRGEIIAAVCAAVAEENGTDISAIRVVSFKKIN